MFLSNRSPRTAYLYLAENNVNGKVYVGYALNPKSRWNSHKAVAKGGFEKYPNDFSYFHRALAKHKPENFTFTICAAYPSEEEAKFAEIFWIAELKRYGIELYNLTEGGDGAVGFRFTDEEKRALSEARKGKNIGEANPFFGKHHTDEMKLHNNII